MLPIWKKHFVCSSTSSALYVACALEYVFSFGFEIILHMSNEYSINKKRKLSCNNSIVLILPKLILLSSVRKNLCTKSFTFFSLSGKQNLGYWIQYTNSLIWNAWKMLCLSLSKCTMVKRSADTRTRWFLLSSLLIILYS